MPINANCNNCQKDIRLKPSEIKVHNFCSRICSNQFKSQLIRSKTLPNNSVGGFYLTCKTCNDTFKVKANKYYKRKFCSLACAGIGKRDKQANTGKTRPGRSNPNYKHGESCSAWRNLAIGTYGHRCLICNFDIIVQVHHIVPRSKGGNSQVDNLIVLCPNHHGMAHKNLVTTEYLLSLIQRAASQEPHRLRPSRQLEHPLHSNVLVYMPVV